MTHRHEGGKRSLLGVIGPGILVAATGVGAGDLATGAFAGSKLGVAILWAVLVGAGLKYVLNEGLARWQLATGSTLLEGSVAHLGRPVQWGFAVFLLLWTFFVGSALMSACGVTAHAMIGFSSPKIDKIFFGVLHSLVAVVLIRRGGYHLFERMMGICIGLMFVLVVGTAVALRPSWADIISGLAIPRIPDFRNEGLQWTVALMGGVGGTLTVLCYGYWIREEGRHGSQDIPTCRIDLAVGYTMTALFGLSMVIVGSHLGQVEDGGAMLIVRLAEKLETELGRVGGLAKVAFLLGTWGAVFSSLLGVWQSVPYLFADFWRLTRSPDPPASRGPVDTQSLPYRAYLWGIAIVPVAGLLFNFRQVQKMYAIIGAMFIPMLAVVLLVLNGQRKLVGDRFRNSWITTILLLAALAFFVLFGLLEIHNQVLS